MIAIIGVALAMLLIFCLATGDDWASGIGAFFTIAGACGLIWFIHHWVTT